MRLIQAAFFAVVSFTFFTLTAPDVGAQTCGTSVCTEGETCLAGDGVIVDGGGVGGCTLYFEGSFPFPGNAGLDNYGGLSAGTQVHIEGCAVSVAGFCPINWIIRDNTIKDINAPAVPALGRSGRLIAILSVLGVGSFGVWRSRKTALRRRMR
jgi:hypothetical protein